jgi:hypothetical protein
MGRFGVPEDLDGVLLSCTAICQNLLQEPLLTSMEASEQKVFNYN